MAVVLQPWQIFVAAMAGWITRQQDAVIEYLREENRVLKQQIGRTPLRLTDDQRRSPGRRRIMQVIEELIVRMARENSRWGYTRIQGASKNLGHRVGRTTIADILERNGIEPGPQRGNRMTWSQFLKAHWQVLAAADFFTVEVWGLRGLVTFYVLFVIELGTRRIEIAGITPGPSEAWMMQIGRNLTDPFDGFLAEKRHLIIDRDSKYSAAFRDLLNDGGIQVVRLPHRSPNLNA